MVAFVGGGIACLAGAIVAGGPIRYLSLALRVVSLGTLLTTLLMGDAAPLAALGIGGVERWIVYPVVLWLTAFGGFMAGAAGAGDGVGAAFG
jgi:hypothetical protein